jgi:hypothetical protein
MHCILYVPTSICSLHIKLCISCSATESFCSVFIYFFFLLFQAPIFTFNFDLQLETTLFWKIIFCSNVTVQVFLFIFFFFTSTFKGFIVRLNFQSISEIADVATNFYSTRASTGEPYKITRGFEVSYLIR